MAKCSSCGAEILWVRTPSGAAMPLNPAVLIVVTDAGFTIKGRIPHWATCPSAEQHRKQPAGQPATSEVT